MKICFLHKISQLICMIKVQENESMNGSFETQDKIKKVPKIERKRKERVKNREWT
jgi:hypothetical protein